MGGKGLRNPVLEFQELYFSAKILTFLAWEAGRAAATL